MWMILIHFLITNYHINYNEGFYYRPQSQHKKRIESAAVGFVIIILPKRVKYPMGQVVYIYNIFKDINMVYKKSWSRKTSFLQHM